MICPKCDEGRLGKIFFKSVNQFGFYCDFCGTVWYEDENINDQTGHPIDAIRKDNEMEYTLVYIDKKDEENKSIMYPKYK